MCVLKDYVQHRHTNEDTNPQAASKEEATNDETIDIPDAKEIDTTQRPLIPGLPETERVKKPKGKKKTSKKSDETVVKEREFFLKTPEVTKQASSDLLSAYQFSDYEDEAKDEKDTDEEFEDSKEALSDDELLDSQPNADFLTPVNLKSTFARSLQAISTSRPGSTSTPSTNKSIKEKVKPGGALGLGDCQNFFYLR